eukprot:6213781-Pleurochrysis_carterae.AAC.3
MLVSALNAAFATSARSPCACACACVCACACCAGHRHVATGRAKLSRAEKRSRDSCVHSASNSPAAPDASCQCGSCRRSDSCAWQKGWPARVRSKPDGCCHVCDRTPHAHSAVTRCA